MPKLHFVDTGLACHLLGLRTTEQLTDSRYFGGLLESLVYMDCCKHAAWAEQDVELYHFRDNAQNEVDLVLEQPDGGVVGIEVKAAAGVDARDFRGCIGSLKPLASASATASSSTPARKSFLLEGMDSSCMRCRYECCVGMTTARRQLAALADRVPPGRAAAKGFRGGTKATVGGVRSCPPQATFDHASAGRNSESAHAGPTQVILDKTHTLLTSIEYATRAVC